MTGYGGGNFTAAWDGSTYTYYDFSQAWVHLHVMWSDICSNKVVEAQAVTHIADRLIGVGLKPPCCNLEL